MSSVFLKKIAQVHLSSRRGSYRICRCVKPTRVVFKGAWLHQQICEAGLLQAGEQPVTCKGLGTLGDSALSSAPPTTDISALFLSLLKEWPKGVRREKAWAAPVWSPLEDSEEKNSFQVLHPKAST